MSDTIELKLAEIQRAVDVGNAKTQGSLDLVVQRLNQADARDQAQRTELDGIHTRLNRLDRKSARAAGIAVGAAGVISAAEGFVLWALTRR